EADRHPPAAHLVVQEGAAAALELEELGDERERHAVFEPPRPPIEVPLRAPPPREELARDDAVPSTLLLAYAAQIARDRRSRIVQDGHGSPPWSSRASLSAHPGGRSSLDCQRTGRCTVRSMRIRELATRSGVPA